MQWFILKYGSFCMLVFYDGGFCQVFMVDLWVVWMWFCGLELIVADMMVGVCFCEQTEGIKLRLDVSSDY